MSFYSKNIDSSLVHMEQSDRLPIPVEVGCSSDSPPTVVGVEDSSDYPLNAVEAESSSDVDGAPTLVEEQDSSSLLTAVEVEGGDTPPFGDIGSAPVVVEGSSGDSPEPTHTMENSSDSQPPHQLQINSSNTAPPQYNVMYIGHTQVNGSNHRPPVQALRNGSSYGCASIVCVPAPVETRQPFKNYCCYVSVVIVLMCVSVLLVNPVAFLLAGGALVQVLAYHRKVNMY